MSVDGGPILLCYDGSENARHALRVAGAMLAPREAVVVYVWQSLAELLLHTDVHSLTGPMKNAARELDEADEEDARRAVDAGLEVAREAGFDARALIAEGKPKAWPALLEAADHEQASVVVVGSRGLSGAKSALLGSVSAGVMQHGRRPVLVVPRAKPGPGPLLFAYDGSDLAKEAVRLAASLLRARPTAVVTVWTPYGALSPAAALGDPVAVAPEMQGQVDQEIERGAQKVAGEGAELARELGIDATAATVPSTGSVSTALVDYSRELEAGAVVLGSRGRGRVVAALLGSVSRGLLDHAPAPLLIVPPSP